MIARAGWVVVVLSCVAAQETGGADSGGAGGGPKLVISEVMYDPLSSESDEHQTEWVEIHNPGGQSASLQGLQLTSGTKSRPHDARQRFVIGDVTIPPGGRVVIGIGSATSYAGLVLPPRVAHCDESKYAWLTNTGDSIALRDGKGNVIDEVVYSSDAPWPAANRAGGSIQFIAPGGEDPAKANDDAKHWVASGAGNSIEFEGHGRGTPGGPPKGATTQPARKR
ncbi:MAG: lamin tail domain-containing protein [Tepidisphaeraceae bacterium]